MVTWTQTLPVDGRCIVVETGDAGACRSVAEGLLPADAMRIAALPEVLDALESLMGMAAAFPTELHRGHPDVERARAAYAKATGRSL